MGRNKVLTADFVAPPLAPGLGCALLKSKTVCFFISSSPRSLSPSVRRSLNFLMAVGLVRSWAIRSSLFAAGGGVAVELGAGTASELATG